MYEYELVTVVPIPWVRTFKWFQCVDDFWHAKGIDFITWEEDLFIFPLTHEDLR